MTTDGGHGLPGPTDADGSGGRLGSDADHISLDHLAAGAAGLLDANRSREIALHVGGCHSCADAGRRLAELGEQLAALPAPVIPEDVSQRVVGALRAELDPATVLPLGNGKRRDRSRRVPGVAWAGVAAAAAAIALLSVVLVSHLSSSPSTTAAGSAAGSARTPSNGAAVAQLPRVVHATGTDYNSANLASQVHRNLAGPDISGSLTSTPSAPPAAAPKPTDSSFAQGGNGSAPGGVVGASAPVPPQLKPLTTGTRLLACVSQLSGSTALSLPLAVDLARFDGKPAAVVILPDRSHPGLDDAFVVTPACGEPQAGALLIYYQQVPAL